MSPLKILNVDAVDLYRDKGDVVIRLVTSERSYDVRLLVHQTQALARAMTDTARIR
jgi:hypothetical protein